MVVAGTCAFSGPVFSVSVEWEGALIVPDATEPHFSSGSCLNPHMLLPQAAPVFPGHMSNVPSARDPIAPLSLHQGA